MTEVHWPELTPDEIVDLLRQLQSFDQPAVSGYLDAWQWMSLMSMPEINVTTSDLPLQFRRAGLSCNAPQLLLNLRSEASSGQTGSERNLRRQSLRQLADRGKVGDVWVSEQELFVWTTPESADEVSHLLPGMAEFGKLPDADVGEKRKLSLASSRLDAVLAAAFHLPRSEATVAIEQGFVALNWSEVRRKTVAVKPGDQVVLRGRGRCAILASGPPSKSGRLHLDARLFRA